MRQLPTASFLAESRALVDLGVGTVRTSADAPRARALPLAISETAAAWDSGGDAGACLSFASAFWYFDMLAHAASCGPRA